MNWGRRRAGIPHHRFVTRAAAVSKYSVYQLFNTVLTSLLEVGVKLKNYSVVKDSNWQGYRCNLASWSAATLQLGARVPSAECPRPEALSPTSFSSLLSPQMAAKTVSFSSASPPPTSPTAAPSPRRSSLKLGTLPNLSHPPPTYTHTDPLVRRLRLRDAKGKPVDLSESFGADVKLVGFLFGHAPPPGMRVRS